MEHFLTTTSWTTQRLQTFLGFAQAVKGGGVSQRLDGKAMGMVFFNSSLRTRASFEVGMARLGGHALNLSIGQGMWNLETEEGVVMDGDKAEHVKEAIPVLARYTDVLGVRCFPHGASWEVDRQDPVIAAFARYSTVPVINMESSLWHPCQALADALTWREIGLEPKDKIVITWAYHPRALPMAVVNSAAAVGVQYGLDVTVLRPEPFALDAEIAATIAAQGKESGGTFVQTDDTAALEGAKVVYAKSWGSLKAYGDAPREQSLRDPHRDWQVTAQWMARTDGAKFMHCLPVRRNVVVADEVLDSPASIVVDQAENRLHAQNALLLNLLAD